MVSVVCIHGLGCSPNSFDQLEKCLWDLDASITVVSKTHIPRRFSHPDRVDFPKLAEAISSGLSQRGEYIIVGHSMGGAIAIALAKILKKSVKALVLLEGNLLEDDCGELSSIVSKYPQGTYPAGFYSDIGKLTGTGWRNWEIDHLQYDPFTLYKYAKALVRASTKKGLYADFCALSCKKQLLFGDDYLDTQGNPSRAAIGLLADDELYYISGAGHFLMQDKPMSCALRILELADLRNSK